MERAVEMQQTQSITKKCPTCQATITSTTGYVSWCMECNWNVYPLKPEPRNMLEKIYLSLGQQQGQALLNQFLQSKTLQPRLTLSKLTATVVAAVIHLLTLSFVVIGIILLVTNWPNIFVMIVTAVCFLLAGFLRPQFPKLPPKILPRSEFTSLYRLVDNIAKSLNAHSVYGIVIDDNFNASYLRATWRRKPILTIGLPLWVILNSQEKIALIGHELGHDINGDATRSFFIGSAIGALGNWFEILNPKYIWEQQAGLLAIGLAPINLGFRGIAYLAWLAALGLSILLWRDSQRAEFLADYLAAKTSSPKAVLGLINKLHYKTTFEVALHRTVIGQDRGRDLFEVLRERAEMLPANEDFEKAESELTSTYGEIQQKLINRYRINIS
jgi:Zn-dependent protease with chaperone function